MDAKKQKAVQLLRESCGENYVFGLGCINRLGELTARFGRRVSVVSDDRVVKTDRLSDRILHRCELQ